MMKHTRGPWHVAQQSYRNAQTGRAGVHYWIESTPGLSLKTDSSSSDEAEGNARLMAAAPDLLAACERMLRELKLFVEAEDEEDDVCEMARAAIAKATTPPTGSDR
jgi:hypothetical protein